jgi:hypothetical protein
MSKFYSKHSKLFNRVKIISLMEMDVSEARGQPSWDFQKVDKTLTNQIELIRGYARFTLEHFPLRQRMTLCALCAKLLILCGVTKVVETRYEIFGLCLQISAMSSHPI